MYLTSDDNAARFALGDLGTNNLIVFGVNPSKATDQKFDQTIRRIQGYSHAHGFGVEHGEFFFAMLLPCAD